MVSPETGYARLGDAVVFADSSNLATILRSAPETDWLGYQTAERAWYKTADDNTCQADAVRDWN